MGSDYSYYRCELSGSRHVLKCECIETQLDRAASRRFDHEQGFQRPRARRIALTSALAESQLKTSSTALIDLLYESLVDPARCTEYVQALLEVSGSAGAFSVLGDAAGNIFSFRETGFGEPMEPYYHDAFEQLHLWERSRVSGTWVVVDSVRSVVDDRDLRMCGMAAGAAAFAQVEDCCGSSKLRLALFKHDRSGPYTGQQLAVLQTLVRHYRWWLKLHRETSLLREGVNAAVESISVPCVLVDPARRVLASNSGADTLIADGAMLTVQHGRLGVRSFDLDKWLQGHESANESDEAMDGTVGVVARVPRRNRMPVFLTVNLLSSSPAAGYGKVVALMFHDPERKSLPSQQVLSEVYGLTRAEARVAGFVLEGLTVIEMAATLGVSADTVKFHLKSIFSKVGVRRQSELVGHLLSSSIDFSELSIKLKKGNTSTTEK